MGVSVIVGGCGCVGVHVCELCLLCFVHWSVL